ncbi:MULTISPECIES: hypothetical protein [Rhodomicrobium]|uniref:hypothetical protein n=1 Tax=Rhodomicrobium TaxID=1068 RepID=UPI000F74A497|nr:MULTISPECIES: hypothetical protein [Rhodomicrobium]
MDTPHLFNLLSSFSDDAPWLKPLVPQLLDGHFQRISQPSGGKYESFALRAELMIRVAHARDAGIAVLGSEDLLSHLSSISPETEIKNFAFSKKDTLLVIYLDVSDKIVGVIFVRK